ncbi:MAG: AGE family epimerase/isomerase [Polyangiaceae bacterium]
MTRRFPRLAPSTLLALALFGCGPTNIPSAAAPVVEPRVAAPSASVAPTPDPRTQAIVARIDALGKDVIAFWKQHGPDRQNGGFYGTLDRQGRSIAPFDKGAIQQARHLWTFSTWYARREATPEIKAIADGSYRFVVDHLRDPSDAEYFFKTDSSGKPIDRKKPLYAQSFVIYALAQYADTFHVAEARDHALACFRSIDRRAHDPVHKGYDQTKDPFYFTAGTQKQTNTHIHLLEAFTTLYRVTQDSVVRARLEELVDVTAHRIVQPSGYARQEFKLDFSPFGVTEASYGHDIETSWLLYDALDALGWSKNQELAGIAQRLGRGALEAGYDAEHGGLFEAGEPGQAPSKRDKVWWIQAETLPGIAQLYLHQPAPNDLERLERTLSFIEKHQRDGEFGEWYWSTRPDGSPSEHPPNKGEEWKASYHTTRALIFAADWLRR